MNKMKYLAILLLFCIIGFGCSNHKNCKKYPETFLNAYFPYQIEQKISFISDTDTINFIVNDLSVFETIKLSSPSFCKCEPSCPQISVKMIDAINNILLEHYIQAGDDVSNINVYLYDLLKKDNELKRNIGACGSSLYADPYDKNVSDVYGEIIAIKGNPYRRFIQVDIIKNKGIAVFYEKLENGDTRKWELVE